MWAQATLAARDKNKKVLGSAPLQMLPTQLTKPRGSLRMDWGPLFGLSTAGTRTNRATSSSQSATPQATFSPTLLLHPPSPAICQSATPQRCSRRFLLRPVSLSSHMLGVTCGLHGTRSNKGRLLDVEAAGTPPRTRDHSRRRSGRRALASARLPSTLMGNAALVGAWASLPVGHPAWCRNYI